MKTGKHDIAKSNFQSAFILRKPGLVNFNQLFVFFLVQVLDDFIKEVGKRIVESKLILKVVHQSSIGCVFISKLVHNSSSMSFRSGRETIINTTRVRLGLSRDYRHDIYLIA